MTAELLSRWISCIYRQGQIYIERELGEHGIGSGQHFIVSTVCAHPGLSQDKLCEMLAMNKGTVARALRQLEDGGFVQRDVNERNRRANMVYPTPKALETQAVVDGVVAAWDAELTAHMNESERLLFRALLKRAAENSVARVRPQFSRRRRNKFLASLRGGQDES